MTPRYPGEALATPYGGEHDPERALWTPSRRRFLFLFGAAAVAPLLPELPAGPSRGLLALRAEVARLESPSYSAAMAELIANLECLTVALAGLPGPIVDPVAVAISDRRLLEAAGVDVNRIEVTPHLGLLSLRKVV